MKEIRELSKLNNVELFLVRDDIIRSLNENSTFEMDDKGKNFSNTV